MTETQRVAMRLALEALTLVYPNPLQVEAREALRAALDEPEPGPVAWAAEIIDALQAQYDTEMIQENDSGDALVRLDQAIAAVEEVEKYYTAAPPARRPLTLEEIMDAVRDADLDWHTGWSLGDDAPNRYITLIRAIERKITGGNDE